MKTFAFAILSAFIGFAALADVELLDDSLIKIESAGHLNQVRADLVKAIWKEAGYPADKTPAVEHNVSLPLPELAASVAATDKLVTEMDQGFSSTAYHLHPLKAQNKLAIFHQGHDDVLLNGGGEQTVRFFLDRGYDVLVHWMPLKGPNKHKAEKPMTTHDEMINLASDTLPYHPMRLFLEPVITSLNHALKENAPSQVVMIGISGGGWATTFIAALDPRVQLSFPVAGSMPLYTRTGGSIGDLEQYTPDIYAIAGYPDLYVMGSHGAGRAQLQILNHEDPCCFAVKTEPKYVAEVQARVKEIGAGDFKFSIDTSHSGHMISEHALKEFVKPALQF